MSNITGGELSYVITVDTKQLKTQLKDGEKTLMGFNDVAEKAGESLDKMVDGNILKNLKSMGIEIGKTGSELKKALKDADEFVSGMESGLKIVVAEHAKLLAEINKMPEGGARNQLLEEYRAEGVEIEKVSQQITQYKEFISSVKEESKSLSSKLKEVTDEMKVLYDRGEENSQRYQELAQKASEYQKANEAVNKSLKALKDNAGLTALVETMGLASGIFSTYQGITALVGKENEDLEKIMIRLQSAIAVTVGVQQIQNSLSKESSLLQSIQAVQTLARAKADEIAAASTGKATIAQRAFNLVAKANPYVLLATAILSVVGAVYLFTRRTDEASNIQKKMSDALKEGASSTAKELVELEKLYRTATNDKISREQRLKAVNALKAAYPGQLSLIREEIILNGKAADSYIALKNAILEKAKANAAQKVVEDAYSEQLKNQQGYFDELNILYGQTAEIKKRIQKDGQFSEVDGIFGNKVRVDNYEKLRQTRERVAAINKEIGSQNKELDKKYKGVVNTIVTGNAAIDAATTAPPPNKGTGEWYKEEISRLEELRQKAIVGSAEWKKLGKQIENYQNLLNPKSSSPSVKSTSTPNSVADEYLPEGSVAEIQRRLSKIDEALSKATTDSQRNDLKAKRISTAKELAEAEKLIQIKTLQEQFDESEKLWQQYYSAVESIGKPKADEIFGDAIKNDKSSYDSLIKQRDDLKNKKNLTDEEKNYFSFIDEKINSMLGKQSRLETFKQTIEETLGMLGTDAEKLKFIEEQKTTANKTTGEYAVLEDYNRKIQEAQKQRYQEFLAAHQSFEERRNSITENYATLRQTIEADATLNNEQKKNALEKAAQEEADAYSDAFMTELVNNPQYREAFADLERQTTAQLKKTRESLLKDLSDNSKKLNPEAIDSIKKRIEDLDNVIGNRNPYDKLKDSIKVLGDESASTADKMKAISNVTDSIDTYINAAKSIMSDVTGALDDMGVQLSDSTKDTLDNINQTLDGLSKMSEGTKEFAQGFLTGDPVKMVTGAVKYISGAIKAISAWTNGDKKKERQIKAWADQVENLKIQYQELERAMNKALGDDKYKNQQEQIANLERQKILLQQMIKKEEDKKKTDKGKIKDWQQQISDINNQISDIKDNIVNDILQIDVKGLADKIGDALIEGFGRGEDALDSLNKTADEIFKDMVKNALEMELEKKMQPIIDEMLKAMGYSSSVNDDAIKAQIEALEKQKKELEKQINLLSPTFNPLELKANKSQIESINKLIAEQKSKLGQTTGSFDGLTEEEREAIKAQIVAATGDYQKAMEQYADLFGPDAANNPNGLKGDIKGITEKTAGALEAQINAIRIYQVENLNISKRNQQILIDSLKHQAEIATNTRSLFPMKTLLEDILTQLKKL